MPRRFKGYKEGKPDWQTWHNAVATYRSECTRAREGHLKARSTDWLNRHSRKCDAIWHYLTTGTILDEFAVEEEDLFDIDQGQERTENGTDLPREEAA